jgi:hypothetical protein
MAARAIRAALAPAGAVPLVAGNACVCDFLERCRRVAPRTGDTRMRPEQWKGCRVVIEEDVATPSAFIMTLVATGPLPAVVNVVVPVTGLAVLVEVLVARVATVAVGAVDRLMSSAEREMRAPGVLEGIAFPFGWGVTCLAPTPELAVVMIVVLVTAMARGRTAFGGETVLVTLLAGSGGMSAHQRELRLVRVVEFGRGPLP